MNEAEVNDSVEKPHASGRPSLKDVASQIYESATGKALVIAVLLLLLQIPIHLISDLIGERQKRHLTVQQDIANSWSGDQIIAGPMLVIPYRSVATTEQKTSDTIRDLVVLPWVSGLKAKLDHQLRSRGPFETVLYDMKFDLTATYRLTVEMLRGRIPIWSRASLRLAISEPRGLDVRLEVTTDEGTVAPPIGQTISWHDGGMRVVEFDLSDVFSDVVGAENKSLSLRMRGGLKGHRLFGYVPMAQKSDIAIDGDWSSPSFAGHILPDERQVKAGGFNSQWRLNRLNQQFGPYWDGLQKHAPSGAELRGGMLGVKLVRPGDAYTMTDRVTKYANLVLILTFAVYFLFEVLSAVRIHPIQYVMLGLSLCLFYLLLLSLAEKVGFTPAYVISASAVVLQSTLYGLSVLTRHRLAAISGALLTGLYGFLYFVLSMEDWALLTGALTLFATLSALMFATRKVNYWRVASTGQAS